MAHAAHKENRKEDILTTLQRIFLSSVQALYMIINLILITLSGVLSFLLDFAPIKSFVGYVFPRIILYLIAQYLTLLPTYIIVGILVLPLGVSFPIVLLSSFLSFFILFAI